MGALKVWTGSQWTEAGGGLRDVPAGVIGATASRNAAIQNIGTGATKITLDTSDYDTDGYFDDANDRLTIPAGQGGPHIISYSGSIQLSTGKKFLYIYKNGAEWRRWQGEAAAADVFSLVAVDWDAAAGDYYEAYGKVDASTADFGHATDDSAESRLTVVKLGSGNVGGAIGCIAYNSTTQGSLAASTYNPLDLDSEDWDSDGFHDTVTNNSRLTVPAGMGGVYRFTARLITPTGSGSTPYWRKNGSTLVGSGRTMTVDVPQETQLVIELAAGDYIELCEYHGSGTYTVGNASRQFQTEVTMELLATSGADPGRVRTGTAFPSPGAAWTDRFVRTDLDGIEFTHDGTRWVSTQEYSITLEGQSGITATNTSTTWAPLPASDIYVTDIDYVAYVSTAATWVLAVSLLDFDNGSSTLDSYSTASQTAAKLYHVSQSVDTVVSSGDGNTTAAPVAIKPTWTESTGTATFYGGITVHYRLIAT